LAKIGPVDIEIIGPPKINIKIRNSSRTYSPQTCFHQPGGLKKSIHGIRGGFEKQASFQNDVSVILVHRKA